LTIFSFAQVLAASAAGAGRVPPVERKNYRLQDIQLSAFAVWASADERAL
jgi:hypothetical protein